METTKLCICTNIPKELENDNYEVGKIYRHLEGEGEGFKNGWKMVYGVQMDAKLYEGNFIMLAPVMLQLFKMMHMLKEDGSPLSKSAFKERASIHTYGGRTGYKIFHFYTNSPKTRLISFYPMQGNLRDQTQECYEYYMDIINGDMEPIDSKDVQIGNSGIPIGYGDIYFKWDKTILDILEDEPVNDIFG